MPVEKKIVWKNKEDPLNLYGMHAGLVIAILMMTGLLILGVGIAPGLFLGAIVLAVAYITTANKPKWWFTYGLLYLVRRRSVLSPGVSPAPELEGKLHEARRLYEAE